MTAGLLNIAGFQNLKYQDQGIFRTSRRMHFYIPQFSISVRCQTTR